MYAVKFIVDGETFYLSHYLFRPDQDFNEGMINDPDRADIAFPYTVHVDPIRKSFTIYVNRVKRIYVCKIGAMYRSDFYEGSLPCVNMITAVNKRLTQYFAVVPMSGDYYMVQADQQRNIKICNDSAGYYLSNQTYMLELCQDILGLNKHDLVERFGLEESGTWPYGTHEQQLRVLEALNSNSHAVVDKPKSVRYKDSCLTIGNDKFIIKQTRFGKYYLYGDMDKLFYLLQVKNRADFLRLLRPLFNGDQKMTGIFPETRTKEELESIIKFIIICMD